VAIPEGCGVRAINWSMVRLKNIKFLPEKSEKCGQ